ncbi:MAG: DUF3293 domain-containing protein [Nevskiaceae bacterium]|nr:MAG: DUF3293 domain-containing protein [Nevskiaceae bacterium]TBR74609.1 MAG: DUF3293 domain-containing protein [Nevskiaceae bacterium]
MPTTEADRRFPTAGNSGKLPASMPADYAQTRFFTSDLVAAWPSQFAIITACATTGETWTAARNAAADEALEAVLRQKGCEITRITGYSPVTLHAEPGWAVALGFDTACELGLCFRQDAIYYVVDGTLYVSHCDAPRRCLIPIGPFFPRLHVAGPQC